MVKKQLRQPSPLVLVDIIMTKQLKIAVVNTVTFTGGVQNSSQKHYKLSRNFEVNSASW